MPKDSKEVTLWLQVQLEGPFVRNHEIVKLGFPSIQMMENLLKKENKMILMRMLRNLEKTIHNCEIDCILGFRI